MPTAALLELPGDRLRHVVLNWPRVVVDALEERIGWLEFRLGLDAGYQQAHDVTDQKTIATPTSCPALVMIMDKMPGLKSMRDRAIVYSVSVTSTRLAPPAGEVRSLRWASTGRWSPFPNLIKLR